jgi:predicted ATPase
MLTELSVQNFKALQDTKPIRMAPITGFFGPNSSGKSSISQFLLLLKQTVQSPDRSQVLHFGDKRTAIDLGSFHDVAHAHDESRIISFKISWNLKKPIKLKSGNKIFSGDRIQFTAEIGRATSKRPEIAVLKMNYVFGDPQGKGVEIGMERSSEDRNSYALTGDLYGKGRKQKVILPAPVRFYGFPEEVFASVREVDFVRELVLHLEKRLQSIYYLGPLRSHPQRSYSWSGENPEDVGWAGERAIDAILAAHNRTLSIRSSSGNLRFDVVIAHWLKRLGVIETFELKKVGEHRKDYDVLVTTPGAKKNVYLTEVGFGVSQVLPILVECFYAPPGSIIIIEQPELHLHPAVQSSLADFFIDVIHARDNSGERDIQLILESHSEHFLRRLQRRVAEEELMPTEAAI